MHNHVVRRHRRRAGFTIIEVLATAVILGVGLVGVGSMVTYATISHQKSVNYTVASDRATQELERIREASYVGAVVGTALFPAGTYTIVNSTTASFTVPDLSHGTGLITLDEDSEAKVINPSTGLPYNNLKKAAVTITWSGGHFMGGSYRAVTLIANRPK
jgi:prepilin-type N-terminal cleavage/methylation domain-containing protein